MRLLRLRGWPAPRFPWMETLTVVDTDAGMYRSLQVYSNQLPRLADRGYERLEWLFFEDARPLCVVPGCVDKARMEFYAAEDGRLAGRAWRRGDPIKVCSEHGLDVYRAQGVYGVDQLAAWLRPDALLDPLDQMDLDLGDIGAARWSEARRRVLRVSMNPPEQT